MENLNEYWCFVPESDGRYAISNRGRLLQIGRRERHGRQMISVLTNRIKDIVCDFKTRQLGWYVFFDGEKRFWPRDALMSLFGDFPTDVITDNDQAAIATRDELFRDLPKRTGWRRESRDGGLEQRKPIYGGAYARP